jgi:hypothetical protein
MRNIGELNKVLGEKGFFLGPNCFFNLVKINRTAFATARGAGFCLKRAVHEPAQVSGRASEKQNNQCALNHAPKLHKT